MSSLSYVRPVAERRRVGSYVAVTEHVDPTGICPLHVVLLTVVFPRSALTCTEDTLNGMSPSLSRVADTV